MLLKVSKTTRTRWGQCSVLIIDEVSMLDGDFFDKLDQATWMGAQSVHRMQDHMVRNAVTAASATAQYMFVL